MRNAAPKLELLGLLCPYKEMNFYCIPEIRNILYAEGNKLVKEKFVNYFLFVAVTTGIERSRIT
jgi:hypothetical protein